jgi:hypothetical protein
MIWLPICTLWCSIKRNCLYTFKRYQVQNVWRTSTEGKIRSLPVNDADVVGWLLVCRVGYQTFLMTFIQVEIERLYHWSATVSSCLRAVLPHQNDGSRISLSFQRIKLDKIGAEQVKRKCWTREFLLEAIEKSRTPVFWAKADRVKKIAQMKPINRSWRNNGLEFIKKQTRFFTNEIWRILDLEHHPSSWP